MTSTARGPANPIAFALSRDDAAVLRALLADAGIDAAEGPFEPAASHLGFGFPEIVAVIVQLTPLAEIAAQTMHVHVLAGVVKAFIATRHRTLVVDYDAGGGFKLESTLSSGELVPILQTLLHERNGTIFALPPAGRKRPDK